MAKAMESSSKKVVGNGRYCAVFGCSNGDYGLKKWSQLLCPLHHCFHGSDECNCRPPYELHSFPTKLKKPLQRQKWLQLLNRNKPHSKKLWNPGRSARVCCKHFVDGVPTDENPYPTQNLGYNSKRKVENVNSTANPRRRKKAKTSQSVATPMDVDHDHSYFTLSSQSSSSCHPENNSPLDKCPSPNANEGNNGDANSEGIFVNLLQVVLFLYGFICVGNILNFVYVFALGCRQKINIILILCAQVLSLGDENERLKKQINHLKKKDES